MTPTPATPAADGLRALFVHAHPDDEAITTGGTIAALVAAGAEVRVITCTLGEEGEVIGDALSGLVADRADQLGGYRIGELGIALRALGVDRTRFLGGAGRWRDSGMAGTPSADHPRAFVRSGGEAVAELVAVLDDFRPHLVVTYDPRGGYGHPDHIRAHEVVHAAIEESAHRPDRVAWTVTARSELDRTHPEPPAHLRHAEPDELPSVPDSRLTHRVPLDDADYAAKLEALTGHATQLELVPGPEGEPWFLALTNGVLQPVPQVEWYIAHDRTGDDGPYVRCQPGSAHLFDGLRGDAS
ncbi:N-acetyl-1-D-myo-inositol-2-amino-2-deoxy-alpha-D-glucopyranoside deacetylase [Dietzia sp. HMSC21D01]|uniref:1D-myo-inositol 2-acetamido-2-deoxy-alpha-D-glucopyranoside deacetylase n=1 Tax=Dietzia cinnamea TaxID=321318 RepID=A0AAW5Q8I9_9ACTN|nr:MULTISPECIES: N-acetyl-1-D-myo-inositol-2-amino-2-deoxy-alpha-D-glucopyranoside deacetylase [Dietzia]MCT1865241.1 N-acetyl-1-D-myo-inositol-2-amino-2-deoxy-alpha-D-glucopyranoside deacetylase [Dietzia cinnamea]MCT2031179.1 N-acetyl-1-D-myo-inositol-2-amino-2-deoxy-alpha-D-glucopyranoside deacetylase [Dietzia cinnamea]MCT2034364.1 N-acetyl-1-D-myo-inositol-2-amino-2-deoxy-alpha-D-glucopyranoside deacetylase [Dietzia cinnamea]MCT2077226.1 N-acetyl-1-D-myo-inositol-2-amino-2-deoxy-alpha-D-gluco